MLFGAEQYSWYQDTSTARDLSISQGLVTTFHRSHRRNTFGNITTVNHKIIWDASYLNQSSVELIQFYRTGVRNTRFKSVLFWDCIVLRAIAACRLRANELENIVQMTWNVVTKPCAIDRSRAVDVSWYQEHYPAPKRRGDIAIWNLMKKSNFSSRSDIVDPT